MKIEWAGNRRLEKSFFKLYQEGELRYDIVNIWQLLGDVWIENDFFKESYCY